MDYMDYLDLKVKNMLYFFIEIHMENQINVGDQNIQQFNQPVNQTVQNSKKPKVSYWVISTVIVCLLLVTLTCLYFLSNINGGISTLLTQKPQTIIPQEPNMNNPVNQNNPLNFFKYIKQVNKTRLQGAEIDAWKVEMNIDLLTNKNINKFTINLFDGNTYGVERDEEKMRESTCSQTECTWIGYIKGRSCIAKNTVTGKCSPGESIIFILNNDTITGTIPAVVGVNQYAYSVGGMTNDPGPFLIKIDPSRFGPD